VTASVTHGRALRYAKGSARGLLHHHRGHGQWTERATGLEPEGKLYKWRQWGWEQLRCRPAHESIGEERGSGGLYTA